MEGNKTHSSVFAKQTFSRSHKCQASRLALSIVKKKKKTTKLISILWSTGISWSDVSLSLLRKQLPVHVVYLCPCTNECYWSHFKMSKLTSNFRTHFKYANYTPMCPRYCSSRYLTGREVSILKPKNLCRTSLRLI